MSDAAEGLRTAPTKLAKTMTATLLQNVKAPPKKKVVDLEAAVVLLIVEARNTTKVSEDPKNADGFKEALQLVEDLTTEIAEAAGEVEDKPKAASEKAGEAKVASKKAGKPKAASEKAGKAKAAPAKK